MKKIIYLLILLTIPLFLSGCLKIDNYDIVTTMFPQYSLAKEIAEDKLNVGLITPLGVDVHSYEFTSRDVMIMSNSKILIYTSDLIEPQIKNLKLKDTKVINLESLIEDDHHDHDDHGAHFWTSFNNLIDMSEIIYEEIIRIDEDNSNYYYQNYILLIEKLDNLKNDYLNLISSSNNKTIFYAGHNAMHELELEMGLEIISLVDDIKPDLDVTSKQIETLANKIITHNAKYLFMPELESIKLANTIVKTVQSKGHQVEILELHGFHNISKNQYNNNITIIDLIIQNYENIRKGLVND